MAGNIQDLWNVKKDGKKTPTALNGKGSRWRARYRGDDGREHSKVFKRKEDAKRWLTAELSRKHQGDWIDPQAGRVLFRDLAKDHANRVDVRQSTRERDAQYLRSMINPRIGGRYVNRLTESDIDNMIRSLVDEGKAPATTRKAVQITAAVLDQAVRLRYVGRNVARGVRLPRLERDEMRFLTADQLNTVCDALGDWRPIGLLGGFGGLRFGEIAGLKATDLNGNALNIRRTASDLEQGVEVGPPKTPSAIRTVTLPRFVVDALPRGSRYMFTNSEGGPLARRNWMRRHWRPKVEKAGFSGLRFHDLRHTHVALLISLGENPKTIAARLGHSSTRTVFDVYGHLYPSADEEAAEKLETFAG